MKTYLLIFALLLVCFAPAQAQQGEQAPNAINQLDGANKRQGLWKFYDNSLNLVLEGNYKDDRPVGVLRYFRNQSLVLEFEYPEKREEKMTWTYYDGNTAVKGYTVAEKNRNTHFFENGQKLNADQILDILSNYETEVAFEGGYGKLQSYLAESLRYPDRARKKGIQGEVYVSFVVNKSGGVREITVVKGVDESLDQEAVRLVQQMPKWVPATFRGYAKETRHSMIIPFKLGEAVAGIGE